MERSQIITTVIGTPAIITLACMIVLGVVGWWCDRSLRLQQQRQDNDRDQRSRGV